jgi:hypothetical protein
MDERLNQIQDYLNERYGLLMVEKKLYSLLAGDEQDGVICAAIASVKGLCQAVDEERYKIEMEFNSLLLSSLDEIESEQIKQIENCVNASNNNATGDYNEDNDDVVVIIESPLSPRYQDFSQLAMIKSDDDDVDVTTQKKDVFIPNQNESTNTSVLDSSNKRLRRFLITHNDEQMNNNEGQVSSN